MNKHTHLKFEMWAYTWLECGVEGWLLLFVLHGRVRRRVRVARYWRVRGCNEHSAREKAGRCIEPPVVVHTRHVQPFHNPPLHSVHKLLLNAQPCIAAYQLNCLDV